MSSENVELYAVRGTFDSVNIAIEEFLDLNGSDPDRIKYIPCAGDIEASLYRVLNPKKLHETKVNLLNAINEHLGEYPTEVVEYQPEEPYVDLTLCEPLGKGSLAHVILQARVTQSDRIIRAETSLDMMGLSKGASKPDIEPIQLVEHIKEVLGLGFSLN